MKAILSLGQARHLAEQLADTLHDVFFTPEHGGIERSRSALNSALTAGAIPTPIPSWPPRTSSR
jgi:hypothetical protein